MSADEYPDEHPGQYRPSIFMTRAASRITLEITDVRAERLQDISEDDAIAEGIETIEAEGVRWKDYTGRAKFFVNPINSFRSLWESINGPDSWTANDWVWPINFKRIV